MAQKELIKAAVAAASAGDDSGLKAVLCQSPGVARAPQPLCAAALAGQGEAVSLLLCAGANPNAPVPSHEQYRPLHRAIEHRGVAKNPGHVRAATLLLAAGADVEARATWMGLTALQTAAMVGDEEFVELILRRDPQIDIYSSAILAEAAHVADFLTFDGRLAGTADGNGLTALHYAALSKRKGAVIDEHLREICILLLKGGADADASTTIGPYEDISVLHFAAGGNFAVAQTLLERGANPDAGLGTCLWREPGAMAELFLLHGANVNAREASGRPLLNSRVHHNLPSVVSWLLDKGADPNRTDKAGNAALHQAVLRGVRGKVVTALLEHGAQAALTNKAGETAADLARARGRNELLELLEAAAA